jgi:hypothetical protein
LARHISLVAAGYANRQDLRRTVPIEAIIMRHAFITIRLLDQAGAGTIAQAEADERLEHQAPATLRAKPAEPSRARQGRSRLLHGQQLVRHRYRRLTRTRRP